MHIRPGPPRIDPEGVIEALENQHDRRILAMAQTGIFTAQELIEETGVPRSTGYRRIERLQELNLLRVEGGGLKAGHAVQRFGAAVEMLSVSVEGGRVDATWRLRESPDERLERLWTLMRE